MRCKDTQNVELNKYFDRNEARYLSKFGSLEKSKEILKKYWGYDSFRPLQEDIVDSVIYGHDTFAILPTGGGKSICFQVPGLARTGLTLVISPLIALMQDQVKNLQSKGINAIMLSSAMTYREIDVALDNARFGNIQFLYTSPERLNSDLFLERCKTMPISLIVVDEAHCISEWGQDFRPSYRDIARIRKIHPETPIIALTASATKKVQQDIIEQLELKHPKLFLGKTARTNLHYKVIESQNKLQDIIDFCKNMPGESGIVYCATRRSVKEVVKQLRANKIPAGFYHGGLSHDDRNFMLKSWMNGQLTVMVATNAFGMGIDKPDVRYVLHYEIPANLESYYQEAGRAGRDGLSAQAIAYWELYDLDIMNERLESKFPAKEDIQKIYNAVCNYLKIAFGSGKQESYEFDARKFCNAFDLQINQVYNALKALELNNILIFSEQSFFPTRLKFSVNNSTLYKFQVTHDKLSNLITLLSRSYPGIYDRFISIHESELAKRLKITTTEFRKQLESLEHYGLIDVTYQSSLPKITFLLERLPEGHISLVGQSYFERKETEQNKLIAIFNYIKTDSCRSAFISEYFGDEAEKCGICDNCLRERNNKYTLDELEALILDKIPASYKQLVQLSGEPKEHVQKALRRLMLEEKIIYEDDSYHKA